MQVDFCIFPTEIKFPGGADEYYKTWPELNNVREDLVLGEIQKFELPAGRRPDLPYEQVEETLLLG
jgi:hypothetical protein